MVIFMPPPFSVGGGGGGVGGGAYSITAVRIDLFTILYLRVPGLAWALKRESYYKMIASTTELSAMILWVQELTEI